jgi:hypothetical protein
MATGSKMMLAVSVLALLSTETNEHHLTNNSNSKTNVVCSVFSIEKQNLGQKLFHYMVFFSPRYD